MTINEALNKGTLMLKGEDLDSPKMKARLLLQDVLKKPRQYLLVHDDETLRDEKKNEYLKNVEKVKNGTPIEYITNYKEFMKMGFFVNENVLIPRQDTEVLVEEAINLAKKINATNILDLCTGSGIIGISIAKYIEKVQITSTDVSPKAIQIAKKNANINNVENKITFIESNLFENIGDIKFDMIISNPPYIKKDIIKNLSKQVQNEPMIALNGGIDGLDFYRKIIKQAYKYLKFGGYLCLEIGYDQKEDVIKLMEKEGIFNNIYSKKDLYDKDRVVIAQIC